MIYNHVYDMHIKTKFVYVTSIRIFSCNGSESVSLLALRFKITIESTVE